VARSSARSLQAALAALVALAAVLAGAVVLLWSRIAHLRAAAAEGASLGDEREPEPNKAVVGLRPGT
jgi:hypothetical protein